MANNLRLSAAMTRAEYEFLSEGVRDPDRPYRWKDQPTFNSCHDKGWVSLNGVTPSGRTALNNVRAAMGAKEWKETV